MKHPFPALKDQADIDREVRKEKFWAWMRRWFPWIGGGITVAAAFAIDPRLIGS